MGLAAGDYDNDGWTDLFVTNYVDETNSLYHNERNGFFLDESAGSGLGPSSLPYIGWATEFVDYDLDGWPDLYIANGHTESDPEKEDPTTTWKQPDFLYRNLGDGTFEDVTATAAPALLEPRSGRGGAFGDLDDDGDIDIVVVNQRAPALVLENTTSGAHWIGFRLTGANGRDAVGARVEVHAAGALRAREVQAGASYLSCNDPRVVFGMGGVTEVDSVAVNWPSGEREAYTGLHVDRYHELRE